MERQARLVELDEEAVSAALAVFLPRARLARHRLLEGGYINSNYLLETDAGDFVLRLHARGAELALKEQALHELLAGTVPVAELVGTSPPAPERPFACSLLRFVPGRSLAQLLAKPNRNQLVQAGRSAGRALALLGAHTFPCGGNLVRGHEAAVLSVEPWPALDFNQWCLFESPAGQRLGALRDQLWDLLQRRTFEDPSGPQLAQLVHGDFNPTNLLFDDDGELAAVLDWEFAHAGSRYMDLGNLLREREGVALPEPFTAALEGSLRDQGAALPADYRARALLVDLSSALDFLSSPDDKPQRHAAAIAQVSRTIAQLKSDD